MATGAVNASITPPSVPDGRNPVGGGHKPVSEIVGNMEAPDGDAALNGLRRGFAGVRSAVDAASRGYVWVRRGRRTEALCRYAGQGGHRGSPTAETLWCSALALRTGKRRSQVR